MVELHREGSVSAVCAAALFRNTIGLGTLGGRGQRVPISSFCLPLLIGTLSSRLPGRPLSVPSPIFFINNDSYALHILTFNLNCFYIGVLISEVEKKTTHFCIISILVLLTRIQKTFSLNWPLGQFSLVLVMSVCHPLL